MMDDRAHLHDGERLLAQFQASSPVLFTHLVRAILDALVLGIVLSIIAVASGWFAANSMPAVWVYVLLFLLAYTAMSFYRWWLWKDSSFRVTTDRILLHHRTSLFSEPMNTIKWNQYQESALKHGRIVEMLFGVRGICIRYGTADAHHIACFPAIAYATDVKHYLDKVDSAVRQGKIDEIKPFVRMPKGLRDKF